MVMGREDQQHVSVIARNASSRHCARKLISVILDAWLLVGLLLLRRRSLQLLAEAFDLLPTSAGFDPMPYPDKRFRDTLSDPAVLFQDAPGGLHKFANMRKAMHVLRCLE